MQETTKKPIKIAFLLMSLLTISVIFSVLSYGYGKANAANEWVDWCDANFINIAEQKGYSVILNQNSALSNPIIEDIINNTIPNKSCFNTSQNNSMACEA